ncbi:site-specific integrase [Dietzia sp. WMMA184]|uniref:site-specific integrase n=1 Tax=Dietzia sp. WMMA184 TaxID=2039808 RepID=UPI000BDF10F6|nr:site-specific integrase [Dietzia sp. WMMA184]
MATIERYSTKSGPRYRVRYRTPDRRQTDKRGFTTKREAQAFLNTVEVSKLEGRYVSHSASRTTISQVASEWMTISEASKAPSSWRSYETAWRVHVMPTWGSTAIGDVTLTGVNRWLATMERKDGRAGKPAPATIERAYTVLLSILDVAVADKLLHSNPARGAEVPARQPKRRTYLTARQVALLASHSGERAELVLTLAYTGLRWGEAIALRRRDVDLEARRIHVDRSVTQIGSRLVEGTPKTSTGVRQVPIPEFLVQRLEQHLLSIGEDDLVFPGHDGDYLPSPDVRRGWFARAQRQAELPRVRIHDLRHTCASLAVSAGANVKALQRMLGHAKASMTLDVYSDLFDSDLDSVADALNQMHRDCGQDVGTKTATGGQAGRLAGNSLP